MNNLNLLKIFLALAMLTALVSGCVPTASNVRKETSQSWSDEWWTASVWIVSDKNQRMAFAAGKLMGKAIQTAQEADDDVVAFGCLGDSWTIALISGREAFDKLSQAVDEGYFLDLDIFDEVAKAAPLMNFTIAYPGRAHWRANSWQINNAPSIVFSIGFAKVVFQISLGPLHSPAAIGSLFDGGNLVVSVRESGDKLLEAKVQPLRGALEFLQANGCPSLDQTRSPFDERQKLIRRPEIIEAPLPAARKGNPGAQKRRGTRAQDHGDYAGAAKWYRLAAEQGEVDAQYSLGWLYAHGLGVPENHVEAEKWYRLAAEQGNFDSQHSMGDIYAKGKGVGQNLIEAYAWFSLAAAQQGRGHSVAARDRDLLRQRLTPEQLTRADSLSRQIATQITESSPKPERY